MDLTNRLRGNTEAARGMAGKFVDENLDGDEDAQEAVQTASVPTVDMDTRGQTGSAMQVVSLIVALTVGAIIAAFLLPIGIAELSAADLGANSSDGADALWGILDVIIVLAVFLFFIAVALAAADRV